MKNFIKNNFTTIVLVISLLAFLKSCNCFTVQKARRQHS
jgi:hypothetical protein